MSLCVLVHCTDESIRWGMYKCPTPRRRSCGPCGLSLHPPSCCLPAGVSEVSRFSNMKLPGVSGVYDYAGPSGNSRYRSLPCCLPPMQKRQRPDCIFSELNTQPTCTPVYASPHTSRCTTQNSGPSGSLLLSHRTLSFPASCRFIPAHCIGDDASTDKRQRIRNVSLRRMPAMRMDFRRTTRNARRSSDPLS